MARDSDESEMESVFPELDLIESADLRDRTVAVWTEALERGGWESDDLHRIPASLHLKHLDIGLAEHTRAVTQVALAAADAYREHYPKTAYDLNRDYVITGGLVHDVGKVLEYDRVDGEWQKSAEGKYVRHPFSGVALCDKHGMPPEIQQMVAFHSHEGDAYDRIPEAVVIHYADFINFDPLLAETP